MYSFCFVFLTQSEEAGGISDYLFNTGAVLLNMQMLQCFYNETSGEFKLQLLRHNVSVSLHKSLFSIKKSTVLLSCSAVPVYFC